MKVRNGFVSNSSSSSFICELCGRQESGWDACPDEFDMCECENGHVICMDEALFENKDENVYDDEDEYLLKEKYCPICQFEVLSKSDAKRYLYSKYKIEDEEVLADIKTRNARRRKVYTVWSLRTCMSGTYGGRRYQFYQPGLQPKGFSTVWGTLQRVCYLWGLFGSLSH